MRHVMLILASLLVVLVLQGCDISDIISSNEYPAVNLTLIGRTSGHGISAELKANDPAHSYSTNSDGFVRLYAKYGQDVLRVTVTYWTLPPSQQRTVTLKFGLSNKAVDQRIVLEDDPYRP